MSVFKVDQKIAIGQKYVVYNQQNQPVYTIKSHLIQLTPHFSVFDQNGQEIAQINKKLISLVPEYEIIVGGKKEATVRKEFFNLFQPKLKVEGPGWEIEGNFIQINWKIVKGFEKIANADKELLTITDKYLLTVYNDVNDLLCICCAIIVDQMEDDDKNNQKNN